MLATLFYMALYLHASFISLYILNQILHLFISPKIYFIYPATT